jgi:hypothetical protein
MAKNSYKLAKGWEDESAAELAESWVNGNRSYVIAKLAECPPNYAAMFFYVLFVEDSGYRRPKGEFGQIVNLLTDACREKMQLA